MLGNARTTPKNGVPPAIPKDPLIDDHKTYIERKKYLHAFIAFFAYRHCKVTNTYATVDPLN